MAVTSQRRTSKRQVRRSRVQLGQEGKAGHSQSEPGGGKCWFKHLLLLPQGRSCGVAARVGPSEGAAPLASPPPGPGSALPTEARTWAQQGPCLCQKEAGQPSECSSCNSNTDPPPPHSQPHILHRHTEPVKTGALNTPQPTPRPPASCPDCGKLWATE